MSRYIDADALKVSITRYAETLLTHKILPTTKDAIKEVISDICFAIEIQSPVDAVHVVRCRDCKHRMIASSEEETHYHYCAKHDHAIDTDWFCADGEKVTE